MERCINTVFIELVRGDGERLEVCELSHETLAHPVVLANLIVKLSQTLSKCGHYDPFDRMDWIPKKLNHEQAAQSGGETRT
jgi:hypothetical protein